MNISSRYLVCILVLVCITFFFSGCSTPSSSMNRIHLGMSKNEVIKTLGNPVSISAKDNCEYLNYNLNENIMYDVLTPYYVRIVDGKVDAYGREGDFDSTAMPQQKIIIDLNQNTEKK